MKKAAEKREALQLRIPRDEKLGAELVAKLEKIAEANGLSLNDVGNLAVAAGLSIVEKNLTALRRPAPETQAA